MNRSSIKEYYARVTAVDIGRTARDLMGDRLTSERDGELRFDCPHHESRSKASFIVDLGKQAFFCKGCGVGGDVLQMVEFVQSGQVTSHRKDVMTDSHRKARDYLASIAGMPPLSEHGLSPDELKKIESKRQEEESVFAVLGDAAQRYHEKLIARADVLEWFMGQYAIGRETIERLKIGFADNDGLLDDYLRKQKGHSWKAINKSGCVTLSKRDGEPYPFFRNRIVFPYWKQGRCVYMIGRKTKWTPDSKYELPKYKKLPTHSPSRSYISPVVQNSVFYNEDCLVAEQDEVVIAEGVTDCIALMARGIATVSPVTVCFRDKDHAKLLSLVRHVKKVFICQDNEISGVGLTGALKTAQFLSRNKIAVRLVELPLTLKQETARAALSEHEIQPGMEAKALDNIKPALSENQRQEIERLLDDAKIDLNEYLLDASVDDFRKLMDAAPRHFEWQIKRLNPKPASSLQRNEDLQPVLETLAELGPLEQNEGIQLLRSHYQGEMKLSRKLIEDALRQCAREHRQKKQTQQASAMAAPQDQNVPQLDAGDENLPRITGAVWSVIEAGNDPPKLFRHGGCAARIERDEKEIPFIAVLGRTRMRHAMARAAWWFRWKGRGPDKPPEQVDALPPLHVVDDVLATPDMPLPVLDGIVEAPVFGFDGVIETAPGYHPGSRLVYAPRKGFRVPEVSAAPTDAEMQKARSVILDDLLADFPFTGDTERAHAVALLLLPFVRNLIDGPTPLHLIEKPSPGTGASLMADVLTYPAMGRSATSMTEGRDDDEWRKRLTATLRTGTSAILIDNLKRRLDSAAVASAITATTWEDRLLGSSTTVRIPIRCAWVATGNNPALSSEIARRTIRIRLDAHQDRPWLRDRGEYKHPKLRQWVSAHRGELVWSALTLAQSWLAAGQPQPRDELSFGMFESWVEVIGGILDHVGIPGFLKNLAEFYEESDAEGTAWRGFVEA